MPPPTVGWVSCVAFGGGVLESRNIYLLIATTAEEVIFNEGFEKFKEEEGEPMASLILESIEDP